MVAPWTLTARWIFPVSGPPLEYGVVTILGDRIDFVGPAGSRRADVELGQHALLPGLVNVHTHLDLGGMRGLAPPSPDFTGWLRAVVHHRRAQTAAEIEQHVRTGIEESLTFGTTLLGDVSSGGLSEPALHAAPLRSVVFYELLGLSLERARQTWEAVTPWMKTRLPWERGSSTAPAGPQRHGLSPHAPYSVRASLFRRVASRARRAPFPITIHLAETLAERDLLERRGGPLVDFLSERGVWEPDGLVRDTDQVLKTFSGIPHVIFAHGNYLEAAAPVPPGGTIAYCPRTHAAFGHPPHPFRDFLARGVRVALGTDSLASNPDLDVLAEARFLHRHHPDVPGAQVLRMATLSGAEALGFDADAGSLEAGKSADVVAIGLPNAPGCDPHDRILASAAPVAAVLLRGQWVRGQVTA